MTGAGKVKKSLIKSFMVIGTGSFLSMLLGFLTTPVITRIVEPTEFGQFSIFTMYSSLATIVVYFGLDQSMLRYFYDDESFDYRKSLLWKCTIPPVLATLAISFGILLLYRYEPVRLEFDKSILCCMCIYVLILVVYRFSLMLIRLQYKSKMYSALGVIQKIFYIVGVFALLYMTNLNHTLVLVFATILSVFICLIVSIVSERQFWDPRKLNIISCGVSSNKLFAYGFPYIFSMGVTALFQATDQLALKHFCTYRDVGIYSSTMTLVHVFAIIQSSFNILWAPTAVEHYTCDKEDKTFYQKGNSVITVVMFFIGISLILVKDAFAVVLGEKYREAAYILPFLIFNPIMYTISETTVNGLVFMKKSAMQVIVAVVSCITNIIGNIILVPICGCRGAAISTGFSYTVFFTMRTILSNRFFYVDFRLKRFYILTAAVALYAFYNTFVPFNYLSVIFYIVCLAVLCILYRDTIKWIIQYAKELSMSRVV